MRKIFPFILSFASLVIFLGACGPKDSNAQERAIAQAVIGTVAHLSTQTPYPTYTPAPTPAPDLEGIFCEYRFCIGHLGDIAFSDGNPNTNPSTYGQGKLIYYRPDLFILFTWVQSGGSWDPQGMIKIAMDEFGDVPKNSVDISLVGPLNVAYQAVEPPATLILRYGAVATWRCGDRDFVWKVYTAREGDPALLLEESLKKFACPRG